MAKAKKSGGNGIIKAMNGLPKIVKLILCLPAIEIIWSIYRLVKFAKPFKALWFVISILLIVPGVAFMWLVDFICILLTNKPLLG